MSARSEASLEKCSPQIERGRNFDPSQEKIVQQSKNNGVASFYENIVINRNRMARDVHIIRTNNPHALLGVFDETKNAIMCYHVVLNRKNEYYLRKEQIFDASTYLGSQKLAKVVASTQLSDDQLDELSQHCRYNTYQLLRQDCMAFARKMAKEIALNENGVSDEEWEMKVERLTIVLDNGISEQSEGKSRRHPNSPKSWFMVLLGFLIYHEKETLYIALFLVVVSLGFVVKRIVIEWQNETGIA